MQKVHGFIGCPGSGKTTLSLKYDPKEWVILTLDDFRQALWPPHKRIYYDVRASGKDKEAQFLLHHVQEKALAGALASGWNVVLADTHIFKESFSNELKIIKEFGLDVEWFLLEVPLGVLIARNKVRENEPGMAVPYEILLERYKALWSLDAWWRSEENVTILSYKDSIQSCVKG